MDDDWEYRAVAVTGRRRRSTGAPAPAGAVEDMTRHGWVLMAVVTDPSAYGGRTWAYFKRPARRLVAA